MAITPAQAASIQSQINSIQSGINQVATSRGVSLVQRPGSSGTSSSDWSTTPINQPTPPPDNQIPADTLNPKNPANQKIIFPENTGKVNYNGILAGLSTTNPDGTPKTLETQKNDVYTKQQDQFQKYLDNLQPPPSSAEAYTRAQRETGILEKQQVVGDLTGKLNQIVATGEANKLSVVGQGRGIPEAIIGGQQAEMARETAIQALPVSAQLQAAQGNLEMAQQNMNTLFKIYSEDATNAYNYKNKINESVMTFLTGEEKIRMDEIQKQDERSYNMKIDQMNNAQSVANSLLSSQPALAAQIGAIDWAKDPNAMIKFNTLASQIRAKQTSSGGGGSTTKPTYVTYQRIVSGNGKLSDLPPSDQKEVEDQLYTNGFYNPTPPQFFVEQIEKQLQQSLVPEKRKALWEAYRMPIITKTPKNSTSNSTLRVP